MAFDKVKTLRAAEKYLEMGKIGPAIKEYCQVVADDPDDFTTLNMLGDLHTRVGNPSEAVSCFRRIAEHYREQGFGLKAIAMYKKIDRLKPNDLEIATHLADLYAQQDLVVDARAHYLAIVEAYNRSGATQNALDVLRKIADLDPQNTQVRTKLAEGYLKEGLKSEAASCFAEAGQSFVARGAFDEALETFGRALELNPTDYSTLKGLLAAHIARGTADEAAEALEQAARENPEDAELLSMLASAYVEADEPNQAERVTAALVTKEPGAYLRFIEIARLYLRADKIAEAVRVVTNITEQMLAEREHEELLGLIEELLTGDSDNVQALRLLVRAHWWLRDVDNLKAALERLAEAAEAAGLEQDERYALTQLTRLVPGQEEYIARLNELGGAEEDASREALPEFEAVAESSPLADAPTEEFVLNSQELVTPVEEADFKWSPDADVSEDWNSVNETNIERGFSFDSIVAEELPGSPSGPPASEEAGDDSRFAAMRAQELESVDFYIAQGYLDIAVDTLDLLEQQAGAHPEIEQRRRQIQNLERGSDSNNAETTAIAGDFNIVSDQFHLESDSSLAPGEESAEPTFIITTAKEAEPAVSSGIDAGLAEIFEEYRASSETESKADSGDFETHYNLGLAYKEMDLFEDALEEFQIAAGMSSPSDGTGRYLQCCNLLGHCFMQTGAPEVAVKWFSKGLNATNVSDEEHLALNYELGAAYEEAGDLSRALECFNEVYGVNVSYRSVNERVRTLKVQLGEKNGNPSQSERRSKQLVN